MTPSQKAIVNSYCKAAALVGVPGAFVPHSDVGALVAGWSAMIVELAVDSGWKFDKENGLKAATAFAASGASVIIAIRIGTILFKAHPAGTFVAVAGNVIGNAACTFVVGQKAAEIFRTKDFDERKALETIIKAASWTFVHIPGLKGVAIPGLNGVVAATVKLRG